MKSSAHHHSTQNELNQDQTLSTTSSTTTISDSTEVTNHTSYLSMIWGTIMTVILTFFCLSCINQFAQLYQALIDKVIIIIIFKFIILFSYVINFFKL